MTTPVSGWQSHHDNDNNNMWENYGASPSVHPSDGDVIEQHDDTTGSSHFLIYGNRPTYRSTGMDSGPCVEYDGSSDHLSFYTTGAASTKHRLDEVIAADEYTVLMAVQITADGSDGTAAKIYDENALIANTNQYWGIHVTTSAGTTTITHYAYDSTDTPPERECSVTLPAQNQTVVIQARKTNSNIYISIDGGTEDSETISGDISGGLSGEVVVGESGDLDYQAFKLGEMYIYQSDLGASNNTYTHLREEWLGESPGGSILPLLNHYGS